MTPPSPGIYKHYKGNLYEVIGIATHSETKERFVIYRVYPVRGRPAIPDKNFVSEEASGTTTTASGRSASNGASGNYELLARPEPMFTPSLKFRPILFRPGV